jgi:tetratricopeptide (TPR) repeat protein
VTLAVIFGWRRRPYLAIGWFWFLGILVPMIGLVQVFTASIADRYSYLSQIGLIVALVWGAAELAGRLNLSARGCAALAGALLLALMLRAGHQVTFWRDDITLWQHAIDLNKDNHFAWYNLGVGRFQRKDREGAIAAQREAIRIYPGSAYYEHNIALTYFAMGDYENAIREYKNALALDPDQEKTHVEYAQALLNLGRYDEAASHLTQAMLLKPDDPLPYAGMGSIYGARNDLDRALECYRKAYALDPNNFQGNYYQGVIALQRKDYATARSFLETTIRLFPKEPTARYQLGLTCAAQGNRAQAMACFQAALELAQSTGNTALAEQIRAEMK